MTRLGTFQKFYTSAELRSLVSTVLGREAFQVGPGMVLVFKDPAAEQEFLSRKQDSRRQVPSWTTERRVAVQAKRTALLQDEILEVSDIALALGRWPSAEEAPQPLRDQLAKQRVGWPAIIRMATERISPSEMSLVALRRTADLSVYFALNIFNRRTHYKSLPSGLQRDVRAFFGGYDAAMAAGRHLLFGLADPTALLEEAAQAQDANLGVLLDEDFWLLASKASSLTPRLRDELLNETLFRSLPHARAVLEAWRRDYNESRPHSKLGWLTPKAYAQAITGHSGRSAALVDGCSDRPIANPDNTSSDHQRTLVTAG